MVAIRGNSMQKSKTYTLIGNGTESEITVNDDEMIVYDVCKIKDYQGGDYVPRKAKTMSYHMLKEMFSQEISDDVPSDEVNTCQE